ncbi:MAG TPA: hypothetical protein DHW45_11240, partial [Candidatus Latescibacteria bacterium]|nr:hypothetical protein [Candidatus Latescibacterota bacterium]
MTVTCQRRLYLSGNHFTCPIVLETLQIDHGNPDRRVDVFRDRNTPCSIAERLPLLAPKARGESHAPHAQEVRKVT